MADHPAMGESIPHYAAIGAASCGMLRDQPKSTFEYAARTSAPLAFK
jgi:hypothetical protein